MLRIDKYLADCGLGTRSEVKNYIKKKFVTVNGNIVSKPDVKIDETKDIICCKGEKVIYEKYVYYLFHKPSGCVTAKQDNLHKTVMDYFPKTIEKDIAPVGRLDLDTEGLLLLTNDGALTHHLLSPTHHVEKTYFAILDKEVPKEAIALFEKGVDIGDDKLTLPAKLTIFPPKKVQSSQNTEKEKYTSELTISEGRFHQVKRMFLAVGCTVLYLKRISMGNLTLGDLEVGEYRKLSLEEIQQLQ
ncbi:MAG: rRNA pseudouridine synthase [Lachnospiraceae bacterium]|nr:rRNA pseudouridine synthase [Lachnospiraceae bacterium]